MSAHALPTALFALSVASSPAFAAFDQFLIHPDLAGWNIGLDGFLGTGDDFVFTGSNNLGAASQFIASNDVYGYFGGSMGVNGFGPFGLNNQKFFGLNAHGFIDTFGEWNLNSSFIFNEPFTQSLNLSAPSVITINPDQTYTTSFRLTDGVSGGTLQVTGTGVYLARDQDPASLYSGNQLTHFQAAIPFLPDDWLGIAHEFQTWEVLDGAFAGTTGFTSTTFFTTDPASIPAPLTPLGDPWITTGSALEVNGEIQVGSTGEPFATFGPGTATLAGGATDSVISLSIGQESNVTVSGAGSDLSVGESVLGFVMAVSPGARLTVENGGHIDALYGAGYFAESGVHVNGTDSRLTLTCVGRDCSAFSAVALDLGFGSDSSVTDGGRIAIDGGEEGFIVGVGVSTGARLSVDGPGSTIDLTGGIEDSSLRGLIVHSTEGAAEASSLAVTNGGQVLVNGTNMVTMLAYNPLLGAMNGTGEVLIDGAGSLLDAGAVFGIGDAPTLDGAGGAGTLIVRDGGLVRADLIYVGERSTVSGSGGTLEGTVEVHGALAPGESPGMMTIDGDLNLAPGGRLVIEIGGTGAGTEYDVLNVTGTANLAGTLEIQLLDGFTPGAGDAFDFLTAALFAGDFDEYVLPTFGGRSFAVSFGPGGFKATVVPVPAALPLLAFGLAALGAWRRRPVSAALLRRRAAGRRTAAACPVPRRI